MLRCLTIRRAARVSTGYQVTWGSGSRIFSSALLRKFDFVPDAEAVAAFPLGGVPRVISLLIPFLMLKGRSSVSVR